MSEDIRIGYTADGGDFYPGLKVFGIRESDADHDHTAQLVGSIGRHDHRMTADRVGIVAGCRRGNVAQTVPGDGIAVTLTGDGCAMVAHLKPRDAVMIAERLMFAAAAFGHPEMVAAFKREGEEDWLFERRMIDWSGGK